MGLVCGCRGCPDVWGRGLRSPVSVVSGMWGRSEEARPLLWTLLWGALRGGIGPRKAGDSSQADGHRQEPVRAPGAPRHAFCPHGSRRGAWPRGASVALGASRQGPFPAQGGGDFIYNLCGLRAMSQPFVTHEGTANFCIGFPFACHCTIYNCPGERLRTAPGLPFPQAASPCLGLASPPGARLPHGPVRRLASAVLSLTAPSGRGS